MPKILCPFNTSVSVNQNDWDTATGSSIHPEFQPSDGQANAGIDQQFPNNQPITKNAIPSVFAKWSLLDTAFNKVAKELDKEVAKELDKGVAKEDAVKKVAEKVAKNGIVADIESQKLVSYALDIAEIFFNFNLYVSSLVGSSIALRIEECDIQTELANISSKII